MWYLSGDTEGCMKVTYDPEVDVLRILFSNTPIEERDDDNLRAVDYAVMG